MCNWNVEEEGGPLRHGIIRLQRIRYSADTGWPIGQEAHEDAEQVRGNQRHIVLSRAGCENVGDALQGRDGRRIGRRPMGLAGCGRTLLRQGLQRVEHVADPKHGGRFRENDFVECKVDVI